MNIYNKHTWEVPYDKIDWLGGRDQEEYGLTTVLCDKPSDSELNQIRRQRWRNVAILIDLAP